MLVDQPMGGQLATVIASTWVELSAVERPNKKPQRPGQDQTRCAVDVSDRVINFDLIHIFAEVNKVLRTLRLTDGPSDVLAGC